MANSTASIFIKPTVAFKCGDTFVFGSWVCTADGAGSFQRRLTMPPNPETGLVTLPEVVTGNLAGKFGEISLYNQHVAFKCGDFVFGSWVCTADGAGSFQRRLTMPPNSETGLVTLPQVVTGNLAGKFGEISLYNQHADFELGSNSNSNSTPPWAIVCESATQPSRADSSLCERFTRSPHNAPTARRAGKEIVPEYDSDSNTVPGYNSASNPLSGFYSDSSYEFDFGSDPDEPESENNSTEQPLSGPTSSLVITSTPAGRFVYWPNRKPADLTGGNSRCVAYLDSLPFQEGTPLAPAGEHTPTEVATSDSSLGTPDRQVFMTTNEIPGPSGTVPDQYLEDISADELSANAPAYETDANRDARRERNRKRNERRRRLREPFLSGTLRKHSTKSRAGCTPP
jgi:hypothetical protein